MSREIDLAIFDSLMDRLERDPVSGKWRLDGCVSAHELNTLRRARDLLAMNHQAQPLPDDLISGDEKEEPGPSLGRSLNLTSLELPGLEDEDIVVCLDFGTAMSKAIAHDMRNDRLLDLAIGQRAGQTFPVYSLISSIYITDSGRVLFGHQAVSESTHASYSGRKRLDSIKDILCKDVVSNLDEAPLEQEYNPTDVRLTKSDIVVLYLAYLTDMALAELANRYGVSRYVRRRFTRPVLPPERAVWAEDELKKLLARAQILADTLSGDWESGLSINEAAHLTKSVRNLESLPTFLVEEAIAEPVAAVNSRVRRSESNDSSRKMLMVVDVGAGTIDIAAFAQVQRPEFPIKYWEIPGSLKVLRQAGDTIDKLLMRRILDDSSITSSDPDYSRIGASLSLRIRQYKEDLFNDGEVQYQLENDAAGTIRIDDFLRHDSVKEFEKAVHARFMEALNGVDASWLDLATPVLPVIFTGGGANLPMVRSIANGQVLVSGKVVEIRPAVAVPEWIKSEYPELEREYLHLAVAIGGAAPELPDLAPASAREFGGLQVDGWVIPPIQKGV